MNKELVLCAGSFCRVPKERKGVFALEWENEIDDGTVAMLGQCRLLCGLSDAFIHQTLLPLGTVKEFPKNAEIIAPGESVDWFGIILEGKVQILHMFSSGEVSLMKTLRESFALGADLLCTRSRRSPYHAVASVAARVLAFPGNILMEPGTLPEPERLEIWKMLLQIIAHESMRKHHRLVILSQHGLRDRILAYLAMQAEQRGSNSFTIPFTREEMADFLCVNRSALSHELSRMKREGLIRFRKNQFTLLAEGREQGIWDSEK